MLRGRYAKALPHFERMRQLAPPTTELQLRVARCLEGMNRFDEAIAICKSVLDREPDEIPAHGIIANANIQSARLTEAEAGLRTALQTLESPDLHQNLAVCLVRQGRVDEAIAEADAALRMNPQSPELQYSKSLLLHFAGRLEESWPLFESRWKLGTMDSWRHLTDKPIWDGSPLNGKRILLYAEQGLGDTIQYARYATLVAERGGRVTLEVQPALRELMKTLPGVDRVIARSEAVGEFDTLCPLLSLPGVFKTSLQTIPATVPYLHADPQKLGRWRSIIPPEPEKLKIGLVWVGGPLLREDHLRSAPLSAFAPLAAVPNTRFYSLQKGPAAAQASHPPAGMELVNLDPLIGDFSDTAAAIAHLDLIISVDTSVVHLAGAMARPTWALILRNTCHTWLLDRETTPWYPTLRLFRQTTLGQWPGVIGQVVEELLKLRR